MLATHGWGLASPVTGGWGAGLQASVPQPAALVRPVLMVTARQVGYIRARSLLEPAAAARAEIRARPLSLPHAEEV